MIDVKDPPYLCCFTTSDSPESIAIRHGTGATVSHFMFVYWSMDWRDWFVLECAGNGLTIRTLTTWLGQGDGSRIVRCFSTPLNVRKSIHDNRNFIGNGYDWGGLLGMAAVEAGRLCGHEYANSMTDPRLWFCSAFGAHVLHGAGMREALADRSTSPQDLLHEVTAQPELFVERDPKVLTLLPPDWPEWLEHG